MAKSCTRKSASANSRHHAERRDGRRRRAPKALGGSPVSLWLYVEDCDALFNRAVAAGGQGGPGPMGQMADQFWGDRSGTFTDPHGFVWTVATHKEDLTPEEMQQRQDGVHEAVRPAGNARIARDCGPRRFPPAGPPAPRRAHRG